MSLQRRCAPRTPVLPISPSLLAARAAAAALLLALAAWAGVAQAQAQPQEVFWAEGAGKVDPALEAMGGAFSALTRTAAPAVVYIEVTFKRGGAFSGDVLEAGQGSGFIITPDGYILTNHHVVGEAEDIVVVLADERRFRARLVGSDEATDVALIKIDGASKLPVLPLGDSGRLGAGQWVMAIGSPLGLRSSVTVGVVSAIGRREVKPDEGRFYSDFIQTDASINPGNSGGPLLSMGGEVVGINTAVNRLGQGIGFAIPINMVKAILPALRDRGFVERAWLGIAIQGMDLHLARSFGLQRSGGALVTFVDPDGPAASVLESGDVILRFDGQEVVESDALPWRASVAGVGRRVKLEVWRGGKRKEVSMTLAPMPGAVLKRPTAPPGRQAEPFKDDGTLGIKVRQQGGQGVFVLELVPSSPARVSGLRPGDVIVEVGSQEVSDVEQFTAQLGAQKGVVRLKVRRLGAFHYFAFPRP